MIFLKLGGSLITDKARPLTARHAVIDRMAYETSEALHANPDLQLVIGHGSGSFGHHLGARHGTRQGARTAADWLGFSKVAGAARQLHQLVMQAFLERELPVMSFSPSAFLISNTGSFEEGFMKSVQLALEAGLIPVVHGDVVFDVSQGATIFSTEQVFNALGRFLEPTRYLLAGIEPGVLAPEGEILEDVHPDDVGQLVFDPPGGEDVTGGMRGKVEEASMFAAEHPQCEVLIFSPEADGSLTQVLLGGGAGTRIGS
jgi:isopentenyl phosphate kinase